MQNLCLICLNNLEDPIYLHCSHAYCQVCIFEQIDYKIKQNLISEEHMVCPHEDCNSRLEQADLIKILTIEKYNSFCEALLEKDAIHGLSKDEKMVTCPNNSCKSQFVVFKSASYFTCKTCKIKYCLECRMKFHENLTCEESASQFLREANQDQKELFAFGKQNGLMPCPTCHNLIEKMSACNFIKCCSLECKGQTFLCYLCGVKLTENDHFNHYELNDPFYSKCRVKNSKGEWVDKDYPEYLAEKSNLNTKGCPKCQTLRKDVCEILPNFNNNICFCKSEECKNTYYCLICKRKLQPNNDKHFEQPFQCKKQSCIVQ